MHVLELKFKLIGNKDSEEQTEAIIELLGYLHSNYQILAEDWPIAEEKDGYTAFVNSADHDSLSELYHNKYVREGLEKLTTVGLELEVIQRGSDPNSSPLCTCPDHSAGYILFTNYIMTESPLRCFECFKVVPIYKVPKTYDDEYYDIRMWKKNYQSYDSLQMSCVKEEPQCLHQLSDLDSDLSENGLEICERIEELTDNKTYYYLMHSTGVSSDTELERKCPGCGGEWHRDKPLHNLFDFVCEECRLLSNIAWSIEDPEDDETD